MPKPAPGCVMVRPRMQSHTLGGIHLPDSVGRISNYGEIVAVADHGRTLESGQLEAMHYVEGEKVCIGPSGLLAEVPLPYAEEGSPIEEKLVWMQQSGILYRLTDDEWALVMRTTTSQAETPVKTSTGAEEKSSIVLPGPGAGTSGISQAQLKGLPTGKGRKH